MANGNTLQATEGWGDYTWTLNGLPLDGNGPVLPYQGAGSYALTATDPLSGCAVTTGLEWGCPGDLDGES